ncbi:hypothetical protein [Kiloniella litopenaei]|uniref:hypothetical protein n=1 Tax=Kiloniella litopenaei TaxID=1549748 RepID=UPI003BACC6FE
MGDKIKSLPDHKTANGKFSSYCKVCWNPIYTLWISDEDHGGVCPEGAKQAHECSDAMGRAKFSAELKKAKEKTEGGR